MVSIQVRLKQLVRPYRQSLSLTIAAGLVNGIATVGLAYALSHLINGVFLESTPLASLYPFLIIFGIAALVRAMAIWAQEAWGNRLSTAVKTHLRQQLMDHLTRLGPAYLKREHPGELVTTLLTGVDTLDAYFSQYLPQMVLSAAIPLLILLIVFPLDLLSGIVFLITAPLIPLFMILIGSLAQHKTQQQWRTLQRISAYFMDLLTGLTALKLFNQSKAHIKIVARLSHQFRDHTMQVLRIAFLSAMVLEILASISTAIIAVEVGLRLLYARMAFQEAFFILLLAPEFYLPMRLLGTRYHAGMEGVAAAERIFAILDKPLPSTPRQSATPDISEADVVLENLHYQFPGRTTPTLHRINLRIPYGKLTVMMGPSGSGKTTLTDLLLKFIEPTEGTIRVGQFPLASIATDHWHRHIIRVSQNPHIFHATLRENLILSGNSLPESRLWDALELVELETWAQQLPAGLETSLEERGARLSGGQKQRIALARAILSSVPWIILDEPTSHLDAESEARILQRLLEYWQDRTVILITHRLSVAHQADQVVILRQGHIVEAGSPPELLVIPSYFKHLLEMGGVV